MKKFLSLFAGMVFVLAFGTASAEELQPENEYTSDKMIRNEDIQKYDQDQGQGTFNQMPALPEAQGSAAGGGSVDTNSTWKNDTSEKAAPVEKGRPDMDNTGGGMGSPSKDRDMYRY